MTGTTHARFALLRQPNSTFDLVTGDLPAPSSAEVLVEILCCTICGSDLHTFSGRRAMSGPMVLGHEIIGRVVDLGPEVRSDVQIGQRVTWTLCASCGDCFFCKRGIPQKCDRLFKYGHEPQASAPWSGGLASHCLLRPGTTILQVPDGLSDDAACPANCATATVMAAFRRAGDVRGGIVVVLGAGMLGLTAAAVARMAGAERVILADVDPRRLELAGEFSADLTVCVADGFDGLRTVVQTETAGRGADCVLEMCGATAAVQASLDLCRTGGCVVWVGSVFPADSIAIAPEQIVRRLLRLEGVHNYTPGDLSCALQFLAAAQAKYGFDRQVEAAFPLEAADEAFRFASEHRPVRLAIRPSV